jgi:hypothetical protein
MFIEIKEDIFTRSDFKGLNYLIQIITYRQRYSFFLELTYVKDTDFYSKLDFDDQNVIEENYNKWIRESSEPDYFVTETTHNQNDFNLDEAIRFFIQPFSIILENSLNDQHFIKAIFKCYDLHGDVQKHLENGWIQFENAGGCTNAVNFINGKLQSFNNLPKENSVYLRCIILLDSDREYPEMILKQDKQKIKDFLDSNHLTVHILEKREMENYLPEFILLQFEDKYLDLYCNFTNPVQKDFFDLEKGFNKNRSDKNYDQNILDLYKNISNEDWKILKNGIGLAPYNKYFKPEFPRLFNDYRITLDHLQSRCNSSELQEIFDKIINLL